MSRVVLEVPDDFETPAVGDDPEFDEIDEKVWEAVVSNGNPEGLSRELGRRRLAYGLFAFGGRKFSKKEGETE